MSALDELHDGRLTRVVTSEKDRTVQFQCFLVDGREVLLTLNGVIDLCVNNLRLGNIVLFAEVFDSVAKIGSEAVAGLAQSRNPGMQARYLEAFARRSAAPRWFVLQSSYGADAVCAFEGELTVT